MITRSITRPVTSPIARGINAAFAVWNPRALFALGEQGVYYDPNDLSTLFQDIAGTTPVTAAGQPVGLMLDKSGYGNHAFQSTAASRPILRQNTTTGAYYLETDGVDDWMSTAAIDFAGALEFSLFTGVRKVSDSETGIILESGTNANSQPGAFYLGAPVGAGISEYGNQVNLGENGTAQRITGYPAPHSAVISLLASTTAHPSRLFTINGTTYTADTVLGAAGLATPRPLYLFRRAGAVLPFGGHFYGLIVVGRLSTNAETRNVARMLAQRAGVTLA
ncbi:hypothetical protein [Pseudomonas sp.]|uniref:hypothetical protein n=1 Tax=Pseudomonas sp. TaxID=306 RepID=UPI00258E6994|nr:hypothetical protein [Pseudomonas sp.]